MLAGSLRSGKRAAGSGQPGEEYLHDDFAYATRNKLIAEIHFSDDRADAHAYGVEGRFAEIEFGFAIQSSDAAPEQKCMERVRALEN